MALDEGMQRAEHSEGGQIICLLLALCLVLPAPPSFVGFAVETWHVSQTGTNTNSLVELTARCKLAVKL